MNKILEILKKIRLISDDNSYKEKDAENISRFLNRMLALQLPDQEILFSEFETILTTVIEHAKETGTYDAGLEDLPILNPTVVESHTLPTVAIHKVSGKQHTTKVPFSVVEKRLEKHTGKIFICKQSNTIFLARDPFSTYNFGSYERVYRLSSPIDYRHKTEPLSILNDTTYYTPLDDIETIEKIWNEQYDKAPDELEKEYYLMTGNILNHWKHIKQNLSKVNIVRVGQGKDRLVGILIPQTVAESLIKQKTNTTNSLYDHLFDKRKPVILNEFEVELTVRKIYGIKTITISPKKEKTPFLPFVPSNFLQPLTYSGKPMALVKVEHIDEFINKLETYLKETQQAFSTQSDNSTNQNAQTDTPKLDLRPYRFATTPNIVETNPLPNTEPNPQPTEPPIFTTTNQTHIRKKQPKMEEQLSLF